MLYLEHAFISAKVDNKLMHAESSLTLSTTLKYCIDAVPSKVAGFISSPITIDLELQPCQDTELGFITFLGLDAGLLLVIVPARTS